MPSDNCAARRGAECARPDNALSCDDPTKSAGDDRSTSAPEPLIGPKELARRLDISIAGVWLGVHAGTIPRPYYPLPKSPRWHWQRLLAELEHTRHVPEDKPNNRRGKPRAPRAGRKPKHPRTDAAPESQSDDESSSTVSDGPRHGGEMSSK